MRSQLVLINFIGLVALGLGVPLQGFSDQWEVALDELGQMHLISRELYLDEELDRPEPIFNPEQDTHFYLYTRDNPEVPHRIINNDLDSIEDSEFDPSHPTRILIHGWGGSMNSQLNVQAREQFFLEGDFNVIVVDWSAGNDPFYPNSRKLVYAVGIATSNMIDFLVNNRGLDREDVVVVGHSLGAHCAGNVGKGQAGRLPTIIGLDPALPFFSGDMIDRIKDTDAEYVEIIHTNGGVLGFMEPIGDADFYPNWGRIQPGCGPDVGGSCAHNRAVEFYVESITSSSGFAARQCASFQNIRDGVCTETGETAHMGGEPPNSGASDVEGIYFLHTNSQSPFAI
ncbi:pancreatic triacylglycerol lipase-like [Uranotaenia lowii]|uniref:pancreatic triacylglycerol lipase-like n=1 Tax=Uranotaenia lowii TaxID=190385 RepID=UPI00247A15E8|nr:pancreatic triacylglycerol lipase-like [Uranotaenia lowii]